MPDPQPGKTQWIRLADVFLIGPLLIYAGTRRKFSPWLDAALTVTGILTIGYNAENYLHHRSASLVRKRAALAAKAAILPDIGVVQPEPGVRYA